MTVRNLTFVAALLWMSSQSAVVFAQRELTEIPVPDAAEELATFNVTEGFEVNLFAADPSIHKPIQMNFDADGRLWIAASEVYPQVAPGQTPTDKVLVLEDTNHDGVSDKTTVFAEGLLIPTGVLPGDGGCYVANSTELLHFTDTDGDGQADHSRIVLSGFGTEDTHHILHTFRWGPDTRFYFNQSIYIHSHVETPYGVKRLNAGGIWQFRPETLELSVLARGWVNTWGHQFDRWGQSFVTDGAGGEGINYLVPGASYPTADGAQRVMQGLNPGSPKYCGLEIVDGRHLPDDWQGNLITHDFRGHRVCRFVVTEDGSGFASRQLPDVISTNHVAFRPIDVAQGPDGAIYIADWYNPIIQHGEVDFRDPRRDHTHGRIWRVTAKGRPVVPAEQLSALTNAQLLDRLGAPEGPTRLHAKRLLKERANAGAEIAPLVLTWVQGLPADHADRDHLQREALWLMLGLNVPQPELLVQVFGSQDGRTRAAAVRVLTDWHGSMPQQATELLTRAVRDDHPRVRLEAVRVLSQIPELRSAELALEVLNQPLDAFLDYALWQTVRELKGQWLPAVLARQTDFDGHLERLLFAIQSTQAAEAIPVCVDWLNQRPVPPELESKLLTLVGTLGGPDHLRLVFDLALAPQTESRRVTELLRALADARGKRQLTPAGDLQSIVALLEHADAHVQQAAAACIGAWQLVALEPELTNVVNKGDRPLAVRRAAMSALSLLGSEASWNTLNSLATSLDAADELSGSAIEMLAGRDAGRAAPLAVSWLQRSKGVEAQGRVVSAFLQNKDGPAALTVALQNQQLPVDTAKIALRTITGSGRNENSLTAAFNTAGGINGMGLALTPAEFEQLVADVRSTGDPARGEALYRRSDLNCMKCHAVAGSGGKVGPDLVSIGSSAQVDYLVDSLLNPNKNVKEGYQTIVVQTEEGRVISGIKLRQSETDLYLRDAENKEQQIPLASIEEQANGGSLMPAGLVDKLTRAELIDLIRFLSELGKEGPYAVSPRQLARTWQTLLPDQESYRRLTRTSDTQLIADDAGVVWVPAYSTVAGMLPMADLPDFTVGKRLAEAGRRVSFVRCEIRVTSGGAVLVGVGEVEGLTIWLSGQPVEPAKELKLELTPGVHQLTFAIDRLIRTEPLQLKLRPAPGGAGAQATFVR